MPTSKKPKAVKAWAVVNSKGRMDVELIDKHRTGALVNAAWENEFCDEGHHVIRVLITPIE